MIFRIDTRDAILHAVDYARRKWPLSWRNLKRGHLASCDKLGVLELSGDIKPSLLGPLKKCSFLSLKFAREALEWPQDDDELVGLLWWLIGSQQLSVELVGQQYLICASKARELQTLATEIPLPLEFEKFISRLAEKSQLSAPHSLFANLVVSNWQGKLQNEDGSLTLLGISCDPQVTQVSANENNEIQQCPVPLPFSPGVGADLVCEAPSNSSQLGSMRRLEFKSIEKVEGGSKSGVDLMTVPSWLKGRKIPSWVRVTFAAEFSHLHASSFGELDRQKIRGLWAKTTADRWYSLCRALGLFGVTFSERLQFCVLSAGVRKSPNPGEPLENLTLVNGRG